MTDTSGAHRVAVAAMPRVTVVALHGVVDQHPEKARIVELELSRKAACCADGRSKKALAGGRAAGIVQGLQSLVVARPQGPVVAAQLAVDAGDGTGPSGARVGVAGDNLLRQRVEQRAFLRGQRPPGLSLCRQETNAPLAAAMPAT